MFISMAHAASDIATTTAPNAGDAFWTNMGLIGVMFLLFYFLLIRPQQKRLKDQRDLLDALEKGDRVVTGGGLIGHVTKIHSDTEVEIDLGGGQVVTALRYTIQNKLDPVKAEKKKATAPKAKTPAKKKAAPSKAKAKKAPAKKKAAA